MMVYGKGRHIQMRYSYVLPDPASFADWREFEADLECMKRAGYEGVELQIADPACFDEERVRQALGAADLPLCAVQTGQTYATRANCLSTADDVIRRRTTDLLLSFVDMAARWKTVLVFGSLQGRLTDEPDRAVGEARIRAAVLEVGAYATLKNVTLAFQPVQHGEVGFHNTIAEVEPVVRDMGLAGLRMMVDTFHMNIEEYDMIAPLAGIRDLLVHVHLCETNRACLGEGHWPTGAFVRELERIGYSGWCSVGVYNSRIPRRERIDRCMAALRGIRASRATKPVSANPVNS
jgi:sugar phosphate isomerase/epimerase